MRWLLILALALPLSAQQPEPRTVDRPFVILAAASFGAAAMDVASTRRCIDAGTCHETNPLMRGSAGRMYGVALGMQAVGVLVSYKLKQQDSKMWMIAPLVGIGAHGVGIGVALRF